MSTTKQQLTDQLITATESSDALVQIGQLLQLAGKAGINMEVAEIAFVEHLAKLTVDYAVRIGKWQELQKLISGDGEQLDYSRFTPEYIARCRGMKAGGLL